MTYTMNGHDRMPRANHTPPQPPQPPPPPAPHASRFDENRIWEAASKPQADERPIAPSNTDRRQEAAGAVERARDLAEKQLEKLLGIPREDLARIAQQADLYLSTVRSYIEALGGDLVFVVRLPWNGEVAMRPDIVLRTRNNPPQA